MDSNEFVIGRVNYDNISYSQVGTQRGSAFFYLENWDYILKTRGYEYIVKINQAALDIMIAEGRTPICSHNPYEEEFMGTLFRMEVDYLWAMYRVVFKLDATAGVWIGTIK